jgi:hypothetical protein
MLLPYPFQRLNVAGDVGVRGGESDGNHSRFWMTTKRRIWPSGLTTTPLKNPIIEHTHIDAQFIHTHMSMHKKYELAATTKSQTYQWVRRCFVDGLAQHGLGLDREHGARHSGI